MSPGADAPGPVRSCVGCRGRAAQAGLVRLVYDREAGLVADDRRRAPGRGAYLHDDPRCWDRARRTRGVVRALRLSGSEAAAVADALIRLAAVRRMGIELAGTPGADAAP